MTVAAAAPKPRKVTRGFILEIAAALNSRDADHR